MPESIKPGKRRRLVAAAADLTYQRGFRATSLADIASDAAVPLGNVYYYFKTKDEIGSAILDERLAHFRATRDELGNLPSARERLKALVQMTVDNREYLARSGCPNGTLSSELRKQDDTLAGRCAALFSEPLEWIAAQFRSIGMGAQSRGLAIHLMAALQGIAVLAHSLSDAEIVLIEAQRLNRWIDQLAGA